MNGTLAGPPAHLLDSLTDIYVLVLDREQRIVYANAAEQAVGIPLSFKGFGAAFDALGKE